VLLELVEEDKEFGHGIFAFLRRIELRLCFFMLLLAIDTSGKQGSIALARAGERSPMQSPESRSSNLCP
jgi:hypothetical protein